MLRTEKWNDRLIELEEMKKLIKFLLKTEIRAKSYDHFSETYQNYSIYKVYSDQADISFFAMIRTKK